MSATAYAYPPSRLSFRPFSEFQLLRTVSQITWQESDEEDALMAIADALLRVPGVVGFEFQPLATFVNLAPYKKLNTASAVSRTRTSSAATANGKIWGEVLIFLDPHQSPRVENPERFVTFVGQQIGLLLQRLYLLQERRLLFLRLDKLNQIVRRRKLLYGAANALARQRNISSTEAISEMVKYARSSRRKLLALSEALILGSKLSKSNRPFLRRPADQEATMIRNA